MRHAEFLDSRLVEVYDAECRWSRDDEFFVAIATELGASDVVDVGCGTGRLTIALAERGFGITGIDPAPASLAAAQRKPGAEHVTWIEGVATDVPASSFDLALMTSHVAQFVVTDHDWTVATAAIAAALRPGGHLVFDTRDPTTRIWDSWNPDESRRTVELAGGQRVVITNEVDGVDGELVHFTRRYEFDDGTVVLSTATLRFRPLSTIRSSLADAGFTVGAVYGGWERQPVGCGDGELLVVARRC